MHGRRLNVIDVTAATTTARPARTASDLTDKSLPRFRRIQMATMPADAAMASVITTWMIPVVVPVILSICPRSFVSALQ